jgi:predicted nucleic acid-binding protein
MDEYLLDTNHVIPLLREKDPRRGVILAKLSLIPAESHVCIATATLAELEVGCCFQEKGRQDAQTEVREVLRANKLDIRPFTQHTAAEYGMLKAVLMRQFAREEVRNAAKWPEVWTSPVKGQPLGADEFDLIMVSHAMERNMVLVTNDPMRRIIEGISSLGSLPRFDNWISGASGARPSP